MSVWYLINQRSDIRGSILLRSQSQINVARLFKGTIFFSSVLSDLLCLLQRYTRFRLSDERKFWNTERWKSFD